MTTPRKTRGAPPSTVIRTEGIDPFIVALRTEQVRQGLSDYALGLATDISPSRLGQIWRGTVPSFKAVRKIADALKRGNPKLNIPFP